jgi:hypothetical protein
MQLPFTIDRFFQVLREYHRAVWPAQLFLLAARRRRIRPDGLSEREFRSIARILAR